MPIFTEEEREEVRKRMIKEVEKAKQTSELFWKDEYPTLPFDEKKKVWLRYFWQAIRWQGESTNDELVIFNPKNYTTWKGFEPEIDIILDFVIDRLEGMYFTDGALIKELNIRLGRALVK